MTGATVALSITPAPVEGGRRRLVARLSPARWVLLAAIVFDLIVSSVAWYIPDILTKHDATALARNSLCYGAAILMVARLRWASLGLAIIATALAVRSGYTGAEQWFNFSIAVLAFMEGSRRFRWAVVAFQTAQVGAVATMGASMGGSLGQTLVFAAMLAGFDLIGIGARTIAGARDRALRRAEHTERENVRIRREERRNLAAELSAVINQRLAGTASDLAAAAAAQEAATMHAHLQRVAQNTSHTLDHVRSLLQVLRAPLCATAVPESPSRLVAFLTRRRTRVIASVILCALAVVVAVLTLPHALDGYATGLGLVVLLIAIAFSWWRPRLALALAAGSTVVPLMGVDYATWAEVAWMLIAAILTRPRVVPARTRAIWFAAFGVFAAVHTLVQWRLADPEPAYTVLNIGFGATAGALLGLGVRGILDAHQQAVLRARQAELARTAIPGNERSAVARDLHDLVGHALSRSSMLILATSASNDVDVLRGTVAKVGRATEEASTELSALVAELGSDAEALPDRMEHPDVVADAVATALSEGGFRPVVDVDLDGAEGPGAQTLARVLREASTNALRYGQSGTTAVLQAGRTDEGRGDLWVRVSTSMRGQRTGHAHSCGLGLRGLRERVDLTGGTFVAGPRDGRWVVEARLPSTVAGAVTETGRIESRWRTVGPVP